MVLATSLLLIVAAPFSSHQSVALVGATVVDVRSGTERRQQVVLVEGGRIRRLGHRDSVPVPPGADHVDVTGKWVVPGLADLHAHAGNDNPWNLALYLAHGVTTIRNPGGVLTPLRLLRENLAAGKVLGPRLFFCGPILDGRPPLWPGVSIVVDEPRLARSAVEFLADQGVDCIKVYNSLSEPVLEAVIASARERGIPVIGHVPRALTMTHAVELGLRHLEHIRITGRELLTKSEADQIDFLPVGRRETLLWERFDLEGAGMRGLIAHLASHQVFLDPTLTVDEDHFVLSRESQQAHPANGLLPKAVQDAWAPHMPDSLGVPPALRKTAVEGFAKRQTFVTRVAAAGVTIVAGTDGPGLGTLLPGVGLHHELELLVAAGLTPLHALQAATVNAARALGRESDLGSVEEGKLADLVILDASPLADIRNLARIHRVMLGGRLYSPAELAARVR